MLIPVWNSECMEMELINMAEQFLLSRGVPQSCWPHLLRITAERMEIGLKAEQRQAIDRLSDTLP